MQAVVSARGGGVVPVTSCGFPALKHFTVLFTKVFHNLRIHLIAMEERRKRKKSAKEKRKEYRESNSQIYGTKKKIESLGKKENGREKTKIRKRKGEKKPEKVVRPSPA